MKSTLRMFALSSLICFGCGGSDDPLESVDKRYTKIMVDLAAADRDSTRNIRNREARKRKIAAENARTAFFKARSNTEAFEEAKASEDPAIQKKLKAYERHRLVAASWTDEEKKEESKLLTRLDEANGVEASWTSADGKTEIPLNLGWRSVSKAGDKLSEANRAELTASFVEHRMQVVGSDLQDLVNLRNKVAKRAGFENYWELGLASQGLTPADVDKIIVELTPVVQPIVQKIEAKIAAHATEKSVENNFANRMMLRRSLGFESARDEADNYFDADLAEERVQTALNDMGLATAGWQVYTGPSRYTRPGVYGFPVRPPNSIAIVMSNDRRWTLWQYEAMAYGGGGAIWWQSIDDNAALSPPMWEPIPPWFEGFASFFQRLTYEPGFHARYVPELPKELRSKLAAWRVNSMARSIASSIVQTKVEQRLYEDPNSLEAITRFAAETRQSLTGSAEAPVTESGLTYDSSLLSAILWTYPAYSQNYLFSAMTEAWMWEAIKASAGDPIGNPKVGEVIKRELIQSGRSIPESLAAMKPGHRIDAIKAYLNQK
ncbi:MAG: hypothetical protein CL930_02380 [Deltaproteobacteria bacterium]|nr:hypothetical protein [Deltaproteobacteria bacterium]